MSELGLVANQSTHSLLPPLGFQQPQLWPQFQNEGRGFFQPILQEETGLPGQEKENFWQTWRGGGPVSEERKEGWDLARQQKERGLKLSVGFLPAAGNQQEEKGWMGARNQTPLKPSRPCQRRQQKTITGPHSGLPQSATEVLTQLTTCAI